MSVVKKVLGQKVLIKKCQRSTRSTRSGVKKVMGEKGHGSRRSWVKKVNGQRSGIKKVRGKKGQM